MKAFFSVFALAAAALAAPESDPNLVYTDGTFHTNLANVQKGVHVPYTAGRVGAVYGSVPAYTSYTGYNPYAAAFGPYAHRVFKREAEAQPEAEADPALIYAGGYTAPGAYASPLTYGAYSPYVVSAGAYSPFYYGARRVVKREAESEPEADPQYFATGYGAYNPLGYSAYNPAVYTAASPYYGNAAYVPSYYNTYGRLFKREAEAEPEADAQFAYTTAAGFAPYRAVSYGAYSAYAPTRYYAGPAYNTYGNRFYY